LNGAKHDTSTKREPQLKQDLTLNGAKHDTPPKRETQHKPECEDGDRARGRRRSARAALDGPASSTMVVDADEVKKLVKDEME
jgi:hypothetical protein